MYFQLSNIDSLRMLDIMRHKLYSYIPFAKMLETNSFIAIAFLCETFLFSGAITLNVGIDGATRGVEAL